MSVIRRQNWLAQQRVDVAHLRATESSVCFDFDLLAGIMMAGKKPVVVSGFFVNTTGITQAEALSIVTANSTLIHFNASESGSIFTVPHDRANETLSSINPRVTGSFTPSVVNYIGADLIRETDDSTVDLVQFIDPVSLIENPRTVPLARTMDYRIVISTTDFDSNPTVAPIARVTLGPTNNITLIEDARHILGRLGSGGSVPTPLYTYPLGFPRFDSTSVTPFTSVDKSITSLKDWMDATMTRVWEQGGGENWFSATADRNVQMFSNNPYTNGNGMQIVGAHIRWRGLGFVFDNSSGYFNEIQDQNTDSAGLTDLANGECIYVDIDRSANRTVAGLNPLVAQKAPLLTLGMSSPRPGNRWVLAWKYGGIVTFRNDRTNNATSFIQVNNIAALRALDGSTFLLGQPVFVGNTNANTPSVHCFWHMENSTLADDDITSVPVLNRAGYMWVRENVPNKRWWVQNFYVDPQNVSGTADDENIGSAGYPLASLSEHARRINGLKLTFSGLATTVTMMSSQNLDDRPNYIGVTTDGARLFIKGTPSAALFSGTLAQVQVARTLDLPTVNDYWMQSSAGVAWPVAGGGLDIQFFVADGTWTKPVAAQTVTVYVIGGGGGGGSGQTNTPEQAFGGSGGSASGVQSRTFLASELGATEPVVVGTGGTGGDAADVGVAQPESGGEGTDGGQSTFSSGPTLVYMDGGLGGAPWYETPSVVLGSSGNAGVGGSGGRANTPGTPGTQGGAGSGLASGGGGGGGSIGEDDAVRSGLRGGNSGTAVFGGDGGESNSATGIAPNGGMNGDGPPDNMSSPQNITGGGGGGGGANHNSSLGAGTGGFGGGQGSGGGGGGGNKTGMPGGSGGGIGRDGVVFVVTQTSTGDNDGVIFKKTNDTECWWWGAKGLTSTRLRISIPNQLTSLDDSFQPDTYESFEVALEAGDTWACYQLPTVYDLRGLEHVPLIAQLCMFDNIQPLFDAHYKMCWFRQGGSLVGRSKMLNCAISDVAADTITSDIDSHVVIGGGMVTGGTIGGGWELNGSGVVDFVGTTTLQKMTMTVTNLTVNDVSVSLFDNGFSSLLTLLNRALVNLIAMGGQGNQGWVWSVGHACNLIIDHDPGIGAEATVPLGITSAAGTPWSIAAVNPGADPLLIDSATAGRLLEPYISIPGAANVLLRGYFE